MQTSLLFARIQFALTAMFHILWPVLSIGLALFLVLVEALWLKTGDVDYYRHASFWSKLFLLNFVLGVVSGVPLEFEFGANWAPFSAITGDFFGNILGFEAAMAFMLEAGFVGIMLFGWRRVSAGMHFFATCMVALGATLSAFWILVANSWMQTPAGGMLKGGVFVIDSYVQAIFNPDMFWGVSHMWVACLETSLFVVGGISAWFLLKERHPEFFLKSLRIALFAAILVTPLQIWLGDGSGRSLFLNQPVKAAAIEGHWVTNVEGQGAPWAVLAWPDKARQTNDWAVEIPNLLSILATRTWHGAVKGLRDVPEQDQPPAMLLIFYGLRIMVAIGFWFLGLSAWTAWAAFRGRLNLASIGRQRRLLLAWFYSIPLGYLAVECGWIVREVGRQPWIVYGLMRTQDAVSNLPASAVAVSLGLFACLYVGLFAAFLIFAKRIIVGGPDMTLEPPRSSW